MAALCVCVCVCVCMFECVCLYMPRGSMPYTQTCNFNITPENMFSHTCARGCMSRVPDQNADLPTCPYLTILVWKSAGSTDAHAYFSKY